MNIIEDLWNGNISPWERPFKQDSPYAELLALVIDIKRICSED